MPSSPERHEFEGYVDHPAAIRGGDADAFVYVRLEAQPRPGVVWEQLPALKLAANRFKICAIPFFAYDLALGDVVATRRLSGHGIVSDVIDKVEMPSGHETYRVRLTVPELAADERDLVERRVVELDASIEPCSRVLIAIDATDDNGQAVADFLAAREKTGRIEYETGRR